MQVIRLINASFPPLKITDTGLRALHWMDVLHVDCLPVVDGTVFTGLITRQDILKQTNQNQPIKNFGLSLPKNSLNESQHIFDAIIFASEKPLGVIPITDRNGNYSGAFTIQHLINYLASLKSLSAEGSIMIIEADKKKNPLSQLIEIAEANDCEILKADVESSDGSPFYRVTLKTNREDLSRVQAAYFRQNINVTGVFHRNDLSEDLQARFDALMNYLNM